MINRYLLKTCVVVIFFGLQFSCKKSHTDIGQSKITFNSDGGSNIGDQTVVVGKLLIAPTPPNKNIWVFDGWYTDENYQNKFDFNTPINGDLTLYAKWKPPFKTVSTFAGNNLGFKNGTGPTTGYSDGIGNNVLFFGLGGIAVDNSNNVWVNEFHGRRIRRISPSGVVVTVAGDGNENYKDGVGLNAEFNGPGSAMTFDSKGNLFIFDSFKLRKITPNGEVTTIAGNALPIQVDGKGAAAGFWTPAGLVCDANDNLILTEFAGVMQIRKITPDGTVTTLCKTNQQYPYINGPLSSAGFTWPQGICINKQGEMFIADQMNYRIRKIGVDGQVSTFAGSGAAGYADGKGTKAVFYQPESIAVDDYGNLYVTETLFGESRLRMISPQGDVCTIIGLQIGFQDGNIDDAKFNIIRGVAVDHQENLFIMDDYNTLIRKISR